jgi:hypothetical protein
MKEQAFNRLIVLLVLALGSAVSLGAPEQQQQSRVFTSPKAGAQPSFCARCLQLASSDVLRHPEKPSVDGSRCAEGSHDTPEPGGSSGLVRFACAVFSAYRGC